MRVYLYIAHEADEDKSANRLATTLRDVMDEDVQIISKPTDFARETPDVVHILGSWTVAASRLHRLAATRGIPILYSPMGSLMPWHTSGRLTKAQQKVVEKASVVHARSLLEDRWLHDGTDHPRIVCIADAFLTKTLATDEMVNQLQALYQKMADTYVATIMSEKTRHTFYILLQVGIAALLLQHEDFVQHAHEQLQALTPDEWKQIFLHAKDQRIITDIRTGLEQLHVTPPTIKLADIERFPLPYQCAGGSLDKVPEDGKTEEAICQAIALLRQEAQNHKAPLCHYADIHRMLRFWDYDEQKLCHLLVDQQLYDYTRSLMDQLAEITGLSEGYKPTDTMT